VTARLDPFRGDRGDEGYIMVIAVLIMAFALAIAGVALTQSQASQKLDAKDIRVQRAEQAADAGLQSAVYALNAQNLAALPLYGTGGLQTLTNTLSCLGLNVSVQVPGVAFAGLSPTAACAQGTPPGAVPVPTFRELGNHTKVSVIVVPTTTTATGGSALGPYNLGFRVVAQGVDDNGTTTTTDDVARRRAVVLSPIQPFSAVEGLNDVSFTGSGLLSVLGVQLATKTLNGDVKANDDISVSGLALVGLNVLEAGGGSILRTSELLYGDDYNGPLLTVASAKKQSSTSFFTRKVPKMDPTKPACPSTCQAQISNKVLSASSGTVTLDAGDYHLCEVSITGSATLRTAAALSPGVGATRVYIDSPTSAYCSGTGGTGNASIRSLNPGVSLSPTLVQLYAAGNGTANGTSVTVGSSSVALTTAAFVYAPQSTVTVHYFVFTGTVIGYDVTMHAVSLLGSLASVITQDLGLSVQPLSNQLGVFQEQQFVTCAGSDVDAANPTKGC
jgi:type II secretory pathway pseudopilin PulG